MVVLIVESWGIRNMSAQKKEEGHMLIPFLEGNGMAVTYVSGVRNLEELEEKMKKENEEKVRASEGLGVILMQRELSSSSSTLDEKGEGNFISNSYLTQKTQNEREKLLP